MRIRDHVWQFIESDLTGRVRGYLGQLFFGKTTEIDIYKDATCLYGLENPNSFNCITTTCPRCRQVLAIPLKAVRGFTAPIVFCPKCRCKQKLTAKQKEETHGNER